MNILSAGGSAASPKVSTSRVWTNRLEEVARSICSSRAELEVNQPAIMEAVDGRSGGSLQREKVGRKKITVAQTERVICLGKAALTRLRRDMVANDERADDELPQSRHSLRPTFSRHSEFLDFGT
jgi:hypothetical protein